MREPARGSTRPSAPSAAPPAAPSAARAHQARQAGILDPSGELRSVVDDCVHCGFCLPACPTYQLWGEEMDSPRGRIHLISQMLDGAQVSEAAASHLDRCLGCMACVPACPSGVRYDRLIEAARTWTEEPPAGAAEGARRWLRARVSSARVRLHQNHRAVHRPGLEKEGSIYPMAAADGGPVKQGAEACAAPLMIAVDSCLNVS